MKAPGKIQLTFYLLGFAGAALFTGLLIRQGASQVGAAFATAGWGIAAVVAYHLIPIFLDAVAWWVLFPKSDRLPLRKLFWMRWVGESVSTLVPSAAVGGDIVRARLAAINGLPLAISAGSVLVDITLGVFTQAGFTLLGLALLVDATGQKSFVRPTLVGTLLGILAVAISRVGVRSVGDFDSDLPRHPDQLIYGFQICFRLGRCEIIGPLGNMRIGAR